MPVSWAATISACWGSPAAVDSDSPLSPYSGRSLGSEMDGGTCTTSDWVASDDEEGFAAYNQGARLRADCRVFAPVYRQRTLASLAARVAGLAVQLVLVAGNAAPGTDALSGFKPSEERRYTLVALVADDGTRARAAGADHVISLPFDPGTFVSDLLDAMR